MASKDELKKLSSRDLARKVMGGNRQDKETAEEILNERGDAREVENLIIGSGGRPNNLFRRITGW